MSKKKTIILGDSLLKFAGEECKKHGHEVLCYPEIQVDELKHKVDNMNLKQHNPDVVVVHVGSNNVRTHMSAQEIMGDIMDLTTSIKEAVPNVKIIVSSILRRGDASERRIHRINNELDWLCSIRDYVMVDGNCWVRSNDFARDGVHLNRRGSYNFGRLLCNVISSVQEGNL